MSDFYLHSDDNYYWTLEAWKELQQPDIDSPDLCEECYSSCMDGPPCSLLVSIPKKKKRGSPNQTTTEEGK